MKNFCTILLSCFFVMCSGNLFSQIDVLGKIKQKTEEKANEEIDKTIDDAMDGEQEIPAEEEQQQQQQEQQTTTESSTETNGSAQTQTTSSSGDSAAKIKTYANYDFVAGEKIIFDDNFATDMDGEFPAHWDIESGQAIVNKQAGKTAFLLTDGNYCRVHPLMKTETYLGNEFTIEFDWYLMQGGYPVMVGFKDAEGQTGEVFFDQYGVSGTFPEKSLTGSLPEDAKGQSLYNNWHHCAIVYKNNQLKTYVDANRVLVMPNVMYQPVTMDFHGIGSLEAPIIFTNVKVAEGGKMNMLDKVMTDGKIITHGILFDVNKATIKPESMGVINQIYTLMKDNNHLKFEIDGHTDSDGSDDANMKLSQDRAEAVKAQLISMGIDASRLSTKGFGESKPLDNNTTPEGKANNRRVEFVKI